MKIDNLEKLFESVYNESLQKFIEINKDNFRAKIDANKSGVSYAQAFLRLDPTGQRTPIMLSGNLRKNHKERYQWHDEYVEGTLSFSGNAEYNSFLVEKLYEELLFERGAEAQKELQTFFTDFANELQRGGVEMGHLNLVDYNAIAA